MQQCSRKWRFWPSWLYWTGARASPWASLWILIHPCCCRFDRDPWLKYVWCLSSQIEGIKKQVQGKYRLIHFWSLMILNFNAFLMSDVTRFSLIYKFSSKAQAVWRLIVNWHRCLSKEALNSDNNVNEVLASGWDIAQLSYMIYSGIFMPPFREGGAVLTDGICLSFNYVMWYSWTRDEFHKSIDNKMPNLGC